MVLAMFKKALQIIVGFAIAILVANTAFAQVEVGVLTSLSDEWAGVGVDILDGARLAIKQVNSAGPAMLLVAEDTKEANGGSQAVNAYRALRMRGIEFFIGPTGVPAGMSLAPLVAREPVLMITPMVGAREFSATAPNIFNVRGIDEAGSRSVARLALNRGWETSAVLASQQPWEASQGRAFKDEFESKGGKVISLEEPLPDTNDLRAQVSRILSHRPQVIFLSNVNRMPLAAKQLSNQGYHGQILTTLLNEALLKEANGKLDGAIFSGFMPAKASFVEKFKSEYGRLPGLGADTGYDAVIALHEALSVATSDDNLEVAKKLSSLIIDGASGRFSFDSDRIAKRELAFFKVVSGKIERVVP